MERAVETAAPALDQLLHRHRAPHGRRSGAERDHQPVAGALDLAPPARIDGRAQELEVLLPKLVGAGRTECLGEGRRIDEIR
jgi:hypothetical protein